MSEPRNRGRPSYQPTEDNRKMVEAMTACGVPAYEVANVLDIDEKTLRKHFYNELSKGHTKANFKVAQSLYQRALNEKGSAGVTAAIFWLKTRAGWREQTGDEPLGKKQLAEQRAANAAEGTDWSELLN
jgi:hypothetical protein